MTRPGVVVVREAEPADLPALLQIWDELREIAGRIERVAAAPSEDGVLDRLKALADDPNSRPVVALVDGEVAGMAVLTCTCYLPLSDQKAVHVDYLHVRAGLRRRGVGKALLAAATAFAEETGADHVVATVLPQLRDTNRFYAQLGFGPVVVRRSVPVTILRRRLAAEGVTGRPDVVARRRTLRRLRAAVARVGD